MHTRVFVSFSELSTRSPVSGWRNIDVNILNTPQLIDIVRTKLDSNVGFAIATLNLDHLYRLQYDDQFHLAYCKHDIVTADGFPVVLVGKAMGRGVSRVTGADIIHPLIALAAEMKWPVAFVGATADSLSKAVEVLKAQYPGLQVAHQESPPMGFGPTTEAAAVLLRRLRDKGAKLCFVALGSPKQELLAALGRDIAPQIGFVSVGGGIDFISGAQIRAPKMLQYLGLEWLWRLLHEPRRLLLRYVRCLQVLPALVVNSIAGRFLFSK